jgi:hypothetical protein
MPKEAEEGSGGDKGGKRDRGDRRERREGREGSRRGPRIASRRRYEKPDDAIEAVIHRYGSRDKAIEALLGEAYDMREESRRRIPSS